MSGLDPSGASARRLNEERFTATAASYATSGIADRHAEYEAVLRLAEPAPADRVLDVGCGPGALLGVLASRVRHGVGVDLTAAMLEQARARLRSLRAGSVSLVRGEAARLPFASGAFSIAVTTYTLHHFGEVRGVLREMIRVLRSPGRLVIGDLVGAEDNHARALANEIERLRDPAHIELHSVRGIEALLASEGLAVTGRVEGSTERELGDWLRLAHAPPERSRLVRERLLGTLSHDTAGMAPSLEGETVRFVHHWAVVGARKP
ncbi:MAG TPA: methyltransferase domain-containing protein [bacterium]|nr:methyltransferase domain-containing protein [bacterium]